MALAALLGSTVMSLRQVSLDSSVVHKVMGSSVEVRFQLTTDPTQITSKVFGSSRSPTSYSMLARAIRIDSSTKYYELRIPVRAITQDRRTLALLPGQILEAQGTFRKSKERRVAALFIVHGSVKVLTPPSRWASALGSIRAHLRALCKGDDAGALIPGMVLGDTSLQSVDFKNAMKRSGLTHLVAVSGANFAIITVFVLWCMQWLFRTYRIRLLVTALALMSFIALVRPSPSVLRAAAMAAVVLVARWAGTRSDPLASLGFAIAAVVLSDPWQSREPGFALSVLATAGLLLLAPRISARLSKYFPTFIASSLSPPIAAIAMCAPILVALSGYLGPMSVIANLLAAPMVAPITVVGFLAALVAPFSQPIASLLIFLVRFPAKWISGVAYWAAEFPVLHLGKGLAGFLLISGIACVIAIFILILRSHRYALLVLTAVILFATWLGQWPGGDWQVANCDVGQGDSLVVNLGGAKAIVVDTGPDAQIEDRCLKELGISAVVLLVLTHFHADHVEGVPGLMRHRSVGQLWVTNTDEPLLESARVYAWLRDVPRSVAVRGRTVGLSSARGRISVESLWPDGAEHGFEALPGDGSVINNASLALRILAPDFSLFVAGDVEPGAQREILSQLTHADIYKVSHHGSIFQDAGLMQRLMPSVSIVSVGAENAYGHPAKQTLDALARLRSKIYRTDKSGAIAIIARSHHLHVRTSAGAWWQKVRFA